VGDKVFSFQRGGSLRNLPLGTLPLDLAEAPSTNPHHPHRQLLDTPHIFSSVFGLDENAVYKAELERTEADDAKSLSSNARRSVRQIKQLFRTRHSSVTEADVPRQPVRSSVHVEY